MRTDGGRANIQSCRRGRTLWAMAVLGVGACQGPVIRGVVPTDWPTDVPAPVVVPLPPGLRVQGPLTAELSIEGHPPASRLAAQYEPADETAGTPARAWFLWAARTEDRGRGIVILLEPSGRVPSGPAHQSRLAGPRLNLTTAQGKPILSYWHGKPAPGQPYPLNDFIHPLIGLDGEILTACSPADHIHHRGVFWAWVRHERKGEPIGSWWIPDNIHVEPGDIATADGPVFSRFAARHFWVHQPKGATSGERFVEEHVVCRVFKSDGAGRAIDIDLTLSALDEGVRIGGTLAKNKGYGGLTIRFGQAAAAKTECDRRAIDKDLNHLRALWVDWTGLFNGPDGKPLPQRSGGALLVHPTHPDRPPEWITRRYGPINVSYPGLNMLEIARDKPLRLRYRIWIHRGDAKQGEVDAHYRAYAADWKWKKQLTMTNDE